MIVLGVQKSHNASACLFVDGKLIYYNQEERITRIKNDGGFPYHCLLEILSITKQLDHVIFTGYDSNVLENNLCHNFMAKMGFVFKKPRFLWFSYYSHHLIHATKAFYSSGFKEAMVVVRDGRGATYKFPNSQIGYETTSVYFFNDNGKFLTFYKRFYSLSQKAVQKFLSSSKGGLSVTLPSLLKYEILPLFESNDEEDVKVELTNKHDIGDVYSGASTFYGFLEEGKLMGLHSYGSTNEKFVPLLTGDEHNKEFNQDYFIKDTISLTVDSKKINGVDPNNLSYKDTVDFAYAIQKGFEKIGLNFLQDVMASTKSSNLVLTGGCSLNVVGNSYFRKNIPRDVNLFIDPLCGDEGNCIGAAIHFMKQELQLDVDFNFKKELVFICPQRDVTNLELTNEVLLNGVEYLDIVNLIKDGEIVSIFQGSAEAGPRALGNRSILFDPRIKNGKDIVNSVKKRENFRPFACSIMLEHSREWFNMCDVDESPYMLYAFDVLNNVKDKIPAVVHVDGSCRVQTVTQEQNFHLYNILKEFYLNTSCPLLLNTSFNLAGEPLVDTIEDALHTIRNSKLKYIFLPETKQLIKKIVFK